ncbi:MAG: VWA domain-containing protein [Thermodesulfobacteriota bacterium]
MQPVMRTVPAIVLGIVTWLPAICCAGGILHVFSPIRDGETVAVARPEIVYSRTAVTVSDSSIEYSVDQRFYNDNDLPLDGLYLVPFPPGQVIEGPELRIDGNRVPVKVAASEECFPLLRSLVLKAQDPSLLTLAGKRLVVVRPLRVGARREKKVTFTYRTPRTAGKDHLELVVPLDGERYSRGPVGELEIDVRFKVSDRVRGQFSPSHRISVFRESPGRRMVSVREHQKHAREDFTLLTICQGDELDVRMFTHKGRGQDGTFMAVVLPPVAEPGNRPQPKDAVFLLDISGSMGRSRIASAKRAVVSAMEILRRGDRFNVLAIDTQVRAMSRKLIDASPENFTEAVKFIASAKPGGATDLYNGLVEGLEQFGSRRRQAVFMLVGDGRPTVGLSDSKTVLDGVRKYNRAHARIYVLAMGDNPDLSLLDQLAATTKGTCVPVLSEQELDRTLKSLLGTVSPPLVSELSLSFDGMSAKHVLPSAIPDLHGQDLAVVFGQYGTDKDISSGVSLRARMGSRQKLVHRQVTFPAHDPAYPFIAPLWAMRRMGELIGSESAGGSDSHTGKEIVRIANLHGFQAPKGMGERQPDGAKYAAGAGLDHLLWSLKRSFHPSDVEAERVRRIDGKVFSFREGRWVDNGYSASMPSRVLDLLGDDYFDSVRKHPQLGKFFAVAPFVTVVHLGTAYQVR